MNQPAAHLADVNPNDIKVSGSWPFPELRWREGILYYLFGIWSGNSNVTDRPKINFGKITLRLNPNDRHYFAYGHAKFTDIQAAPFEDSLVEWSGKQTEVEVALVRFVKDARIRQLRLCLPAVSPASSLVLWKKEKRAEYGYAGFGLPFTWEADGPVWTQEEMLRRY